MMPTGIMATGIGGTTTKLDVTGSRVALFRFSLQLAELRFSSKTPRQARKSRPPSCPRGPTRFGPHRGARSIVVDSSRSSPTIRRVFGCSGSAGACVVASPRSPTRAWSFSAAIQLAEVGGAYRAGYALSPKRQRECGLTLFRSSAEGPRPLRHWHRFAYSASMMSVGRSTCREHCAKCITDDRQRLAAAGSG